MKYADATRCPDCRAVLEGRVRCAVCGFSVDAPEVTAIWQHLEQIDELVASARARVPEPAAPAVEPPPAPATHPTAPLVAPPPMPVAAAAAPQGGGLSAGSVVLGLGATLLVVAAVIFVSFAWGALGIGGRAAILALLTVAVGAAGGWSLQRRLRGSTEALWLVFVGFLSADWFAACGLGLFGLDGLEGWQVALPWFVLLAATSAIVGSVARRVADHPVLTLEVSAGLALVPLLSTVGAVLSDEDVRLFWLMAILVMTAAAVAVTALLLRQVVWAAIAGVAATVSGLVMTVAAVVEATENRPVGAYVGDAHGLPLLLVTAVVAGLAAWRPAREVAVALAVLLLALLVALPLVDPLDGQAWFLWLTALVVATAVVRVPPGIARSPAGTGLVVATGVLALVVLISWSSGLAPLGAVLEAAAEGPRDVPLLAGAPQTSALGGLSWWATSVGGVGLAVLLLVAGRWTEVSAAVRRSGAVVGGLVLATTAATVMADQGVPVVLLATLALAVGLALVLLARWTGLAWEVVGLVVLALAPLLAASGWDAFLVIASVAVVVLLVRAVAANREDLAIAATVVAATWIVVVTVLALAHPDVELEVRPAVSILLAVALVMAVVGTAVRQPPVGWNPGVGLEAVGATTALVALAVGAATGDAAWLAAWCTGAGVTAVSVGLLVHDRRWARFPGAALLGLAWILRLAASEVSTVEAYTLPFAAVALAVGVIALRRDPQLGTFTALGGGLLLGLVPSTLVALADPTSLRALLVGIVAFALLVGGLLARWKALFVLGGAALALVAVVELAPYGFGLPRWILIGVAGLLLLVGGITWEDRVRDGRAAVRFVRSMR